MRPLSPFEQLEFQSLVRPAGSPKVKCSPSDLRGCSAGELRQGQKARLISRHSLGRGWPYHLFRAPSMRTMMPCVRPAGWDQPFIVTPAKYNSLPFKFNVSDSPSWNRCVLKSPRHRKTSCDQTSTNTWLTREASPGFRHETGHPFSSQAVLINNPSDSSHTPGPDPVRQTCAWGVKSRPEFTLRFPHVRGGLVRMGASLNCAPGYSLASPEPLPLTFLIRWLKDWH